MIDLRYSDRRYGFYDVVFVGSRGWQGWTYFGIAALVAAVTALVLR